jgi:hypothetical protein
MAEPFALTIVELMRAATRLEGMGLPRQSPDRELAEARMVKLIAGWTERGLITPSYRWEKRQRVARLYSLADLARTRLVIRLTMDPQRYWNAPRDLGFIPGRQMSPQRVRVILGSLGPEMERELTRPNTQVFLDVDRRGGVVLHRDGLEVELPDGQLRLRLADFIEGNAEVVRELKQAA